MKTIIYSILLSVILAGCSDEPAKPGQGTDDHQSAAPAPKKDVYVPSAQVPDDLHLVKVGESVRDDKGEMTLKAYKKVNQTIKVGPIEMLVKDVKVLHLVPDYSMIDFFHAYTHEEEFDFVKISVEVKNTADDPVKFTPIASVSTGNAKLKTWQDDIYLEELGGRIKGDEMKQGNLGFLLEDAADYSTVDLLTSDTVSEDNKIIEKGQKIMIHF